MWQLTNFSTTQILVEMCKIWKFHDLISCQSISRKIWVAENFLGFHTANCDFSKYVGFTKFLPKENESNISVISTLWIPHCELRFAAMYKMWKKFREINVLLKPLVSRNFCEKSREFKLQTVSKINSYLFEDRRQTLSFDSARLTCLQHCHHWYEL